MTRVSLCGALLALLVSEGARAQNPPEAPDPESGPATKDELFADPEEMTAGTNVFLDDVKVRSKSGNLLRVGDGQHQLWVAPDDPSVLDFIAVGATVDVRGTLRETPSAKQAALIYAASSRAAARMARDRFYVDAWFVSAAP